MGEVQENMLHGKIVCWPQFRVQLTALAIFRIEYVSQVLPRTQVNSGSSHATTAEKGCRSVLFKPEPIARLSVYLSAVWATARPCHTVDLLSPSTRATKELWLVTVGHRHMHRFSSRATSHHATHFSDVVFTASVNKLKAYAEIWQNLTTKILQWR